jgi:hypothetical protein
MNDKGVVLEPLKEPEPNGFVKVILLVETTHYAEVSIPPPVPETEQVPSNRVIEVGNLILNLELVAISLVGKTLTL